MDRTTTVILTFHPSLFHFQGGKQSPQCSAFQSRLVSNQPRQLNVGAGSVLLPKNEVPATNGHNRLVSLNQPSDVPKLPRNEPAPQANESWVVLAVEMIDSMAKQEVSAKGLRHANN